MNLEIFPISSYVLTNATLCGSPAPQHSVPLFSVQPHASVSVCHLEKLLQLRGAARFFVRWKSLQQTSLIHKFNSAKCTIVKSIWRIMSGKIHAETKPRANPWQQRLRETPRSYWELCQFSVPLSKGKRTDLSRKKLKKKNSLKCFGEVSKKVDYQVIHSEKLFEKIPWDLLTCHHSVPKVMTVHIMDHHLVNIAKHRK